MFNDMKFGGDDIDAVIMEGITFKGSSKGGPKKEEAQVLTAAVQPRRRLTSAASGQTDTNKREVNYLLPHKTVKLDSATAIAPLF